MMRPQVAHDAEAYADAYTTPNSDTVAAILEETQTVTPFSMMAGGSKEARFLQALVALTGARRVLEFGTFTGATAVALAEALPDDGRVITLRARRRDRRHRATACGERRTRGQESIS